MKKTRFAIWCLAFVSIVVFCVHHLNAKSYMYKDESGEWRITHNPENLPEGTQLKELNEEVPKYSDEYRREEVDKLESQLQEVESEIDRIYTLKEKALEDIRKKRIMINFQYSRLPSDSTHELAKRAMLEKLDDREQQIKISADRRLDDLRYRRSVLTEKLIKLNDDGD